MKKRQVVIIGGGPAGRTLVHMLHASDQKMPVTLIKDERINANRCAVPYGIPEEKPLERFQIPNALVTDFRAALEIDRVAIMDYQYATHPELAAKPSDNIYVFAVKAALNKLHQTGPAMIAAVC